MKSSNTKFVQLINQLTSQSKKKFWIFQTIVPHGVFALFLGFVIGNLFGTFLNYFRNFVKWDGLIIAFTILAIEFINYLNFKPDKKVQIETDLNESTTKNSYNQLTNINKPLKVYKVDHRIPIISSRRDSNNYNQTSQTKIFHNYEKIINFYKIGLLLGFFIDAFKVGS
uniref:Putative chloroplast RF20 n=1 Tax=Capsosiphon fulvescens TaxID=205396 RepID=A0A3G1RIW6_9CHLO|nr:putative chloroplast RF20 [Capsosiphon fulvescens]AWX64103.1 putative chloroplast RF20 [Capsosiphon fulvescens]